MPVVKAGSSALKTPKHGLPAPFHWSREAVLHFRNHVGFACGKCARSERWSDVGIAPYEPKKACRRAVGRHPQMPPGHVSYPGPPRICLRQIVRLWRTGRSMSAPTAETAGLRRRGRRPRRPAPTYRNGKRTVQWAAPSQYGTERILGSAQNDAIRAQEPPRPLFPLSQLLRLLLRLPGILRLPPGGV